MVWKVVIVWKRILFFSALHSFDSYWCHTLCGNPSDCQSQKPAGPGFRLGPISVVKYWVQIFYHAIYAVAL